MCQLRRGTQGDLPASISHKPLFSPIYTGSIAPWMKKSDIKFGISRPKVATYGRIRCGCTKVPWPSRRRQAEHRQRVLEHPQSCLTWYIIFYVYRCIKWLAYPTRQLMLNRYLVPCILLPIHSSIHVPWYTPALHFPLTSQPRHSLYRIQGVPHKQTKSN